MKRVIFSWLLIAAATGASAQKEKHHIQACVAGFFNGLSIVNADSLKGYSTPDFHLLEDGHVWTMDTLISKMLPMRNSNVQRINSFEFIKTEQHGNIAWVSYHNTARLQRGGTQQVIRWLESAVLVKNKGRWKIQMLHSTKLK